MDEQHFILSLPRREDYDLDTDASGVLGALTVEAAEKDAEKQIAASEHREKQQAHELAASQSVLGRVGAKIGVQHPRARLAKQHRFLAEILESEASTHQSEVRLGIQDSRDLLEQFDTNQTFVLDELLATNPEFPDFLRQQKPYGISWAAWLSDARYGATDAQVLNFLQWNEDHYTRHNTMEDGIDQPKIAEEAAVDKIFVAWKNGLLPRILPERINTARQYESQRPRVIFQDIIRLAGYRALGYANIDGRQVNVPDLKSEQVILHEFGHAFLGTFRMGYQSHRWLDEATTESIARVAVRSTDKIFEPNDGDAYPLEREILSLVIACTGGNLTFDEIVKGYASHDPREKLAVMSAVNSVITQAMEWYSARPAGRGTPSFFESIDREHGDTLSAFATPQEKVLLKKAVTALRALNNAQILQGLVTK